MSKKVIIFIVLVFFMMLPENAYCDQSKKCTGQMILVIDRLSITDLSDEMTPNLMKLQKQGSIGLMNTNVLGSREPENTHVTIGAGQKAAGGEWAGRFYNAPEAVDRAASHFGNREAGGLYHALTGWQYKKGALVNPMIVDILNKNSDTSYQVQVGSLGEALKRNGISAFVIGNSDTSVPRRFGALLVMDKKGSVSEGVIDASINQKDADFPNGFRTNYQKMFSEAYESFKGSSRLLVIELGDLSRLDEMRPLMGLESYSKLRRQSLTRIDDFVGQLLPFIHFADSRVMILTPTPSVEDLKKDNSVTPLIMAGIQYSKGGLLTSASTRRIGIVANTDIAPSVLAYYNLDKTGSMIGREITSVSQRGSLGFVKALDDKLVLTYNQRPVLLKTIAIIEIAAILGSLLIVRFSTRPEWNVFFQKFAMVFLVIPLVVLFYKLIQSPSLFWSIAGLIAFILIITAGLEKLPFSFEGKAAFICILTSVSILIDNLTGSSLIMSSPLGYDPLLGGRYYGIGNEYTGVLMGSTLVGMASFTKILEGSISRLKLNLMLGIYLLITTGILFTPSLGADAGGVITALASFVYFLILINKGRMTLGRALLLGAGIGLMLFFGAVIDRWLNGAEESHMGLAIGQLTSGGWQAIWTIMERKLLMNWKLLRYSIWSEVLMTTIAGLAFFTFYTKGSFKKIEQDHEHLFRGIKGAIVAGIIGFAVNDSGVVQAATTSVYIIFPLIFLVLKLKLEKQ